MTAHSRQDLETRLALAEKIVQEAGAKALDYFNRRETLVIETKRDPQDVVSIADRDVEQLIRARVSESFPQDGFLGEEYGLNAGSSGYTWSGRSHRWHQSPFVNGMPNWVCFHSCVERWRAGGGIIWRHASTSFMSPPRGRARRLTAGNCALDPSRNIRNAVTDASARTNYVTPQLVAKVVENLLEAGGTLIRNGSGADDCLCPAAGRLVGYYEPICTPGIAWRASALCVRLAAISIRSRQMAKTSRRATAVFAATGRE